MRVLFKEPGKEWHTMVIPKELHVLQQMVGGYIQIVPKGSRRDHCVICDEEGRLKDYPYNVTIGNVPYVGNVLICGLDEDGELCDVRESFADVLDGSDLGVEA